MITDKEKRELNFLGRLSIGLMIISIILIILSSILLLKGA